MVSFKALITHSSTTTEVSNVYSAYKLKDKDMFSAQAFDYVNSVFDQSFGQDKYCLYKYRLL